MKNILEKKLTSIVTAAAIAASFAVMSVSVRAFDAPEPDTGAVGEISNGGEWSIYASQVGSARNSTAISDASDKGVVEVTGNAGMSGQFRFDLATMMNNSAVSEGAVVKSAKLRLTPMVTRAGIKHNLYKIDNDFTTTEGKVPVTQFAVPRGGNNDINKDSSVTSLAPEEVTEYPAALSSWQTNIDVTGDAVTAEGQLSFHIEYAGGDKGKTEYATANIAANGRLNGGAVPMLYSGAATDYSKWVYPQIVLEYSDSEAYKSAYADFIAANAELSAGVVTEDSGISLSDASNGSEILLEMYDSALSPIKVDGQSLILNDEYVGDENSAYVRLTVSRTEGEETASYSRVVSVQADYTKSSTISFDAAKNAKGEISVISSGTVYTDGTAYAKQGGVFYIDAGANIGYTANVSVLKEGTDEAVPENEDGSYTMPDCNVEVKAEYSKKTFGTTRIAAANSASLKSNGDKQGNSAAAPNLVIGAGRITFVKFDLSDYNPDVISDASISFNAWNTANTKAVFYVPNNDWDENSISKDFCLDGTEGTSLSGFTYADGTISLLNGADIGQLIIPDGNDASSAANGILKDYYAGSTGTGKSAAFNATDAVNAALERSSDRVITLMLYSTGGGNDASSVMFADTLSNRPSLTITESASALPDDELITEISTAEDLEGFAAIVNGGNSYDGKTVTLLNDLDLSDIYNESGRSWEAIGTQDIGGLKPFAGTFDGQNHSISGLYANNDGTMLGLFGAVTGTVKDITVSGEISGNSVIGGIAGWCSGSITNCHSSVNITSLREAGGIVGTLNNGGVISGCENSGNVAIENKETYAGGIAGHNIDGLVSECSNSGRIENGLDGFRNKLGGIVGFLDNGKIQDSHNTGDVVSNAETASYTADTTQNYVGGIVGYSSYGTVTNSDNSGSVHNAVDYAGGVAGCLKGGDTVLSCTNSGKVSGRDYVGGIAGCNYSSISECGNEGAAAGTGSYVGGVVGYLSVGIIHDCTYNKEINSGLKLAGYNSAGTITSSEEPEPIEYKVVYSGGNAEVSAAAAGTYAVIFAAYDAKGALLGAEVQTIEFTEAGKTTVSPLKLNAEGAEKIKVMLWNNIAGMEPLCAADVK